MTPDGDGGDGDGVAPRGPTRRGLLKWGLATSGVALVGGGALFASRPAPHVDGLRCLSDREYRTMRALAATILPAGGAFPPGADDFDLARRFDGFLADEPPENVRDLRRALWLVEYGPILYDMRARTFSGLDPDGRRAHWDGWERSASALRRKVAVAFRKFSCLVFYDRAAVWPHIGYGRALVHGETE